MGDSNPKIKHDTFTNQYKNSGLKCDNIFSKVISLQCSWIRKVCNGNFHEWIITDHLIRKLIRNHVKFHSNLQVYPC